MSENMYKASPSFWEVQISISYNTHFEVRYSNELFVEKEVLKYGNFYSREFFWTGKYFIFLYGFVQTVNIYPMKRLT